MAVHPPLGARKRLVDRRMRWRDGWEDNSFRKEARGSDRV